MNYNWLSELEFVRKKNKCLLVGVTGSIATGKSTVVNMFRKPGATLIDFDVLNKEVQMPEEPAWRDIVNYFGKQILQGDNTINRKKLSNIVFNDPEKRKKLESLTHPKILERFILKLRGITQKDPNAIILVDVPLMIENNLQHLFHKLLVVYTPRKIQIKRLITRDGISENMARTISRSQLPIEKKVKYADFVIHNDKSLEETQRQVKELWRIFKKIQSESKSGI